MSWRSEAEDGDERNDLMPTPRVSASAWPTQKCVSISRYPDVQIRDVTGPLEVFARTTRWLMDQRRRRQSAYAVELLV
jgi:hypothetical protein